jgi:hypothetical protein
VVVVDGGVVVGGGVDWVVVVKGVPPPLPPPLSAVEVPVLGTAVVDVVVTGGLRLTGCENWRLLVSFASFIRIAVLTEFGFRSMRGDAAASMLTIATRRLEETASVTNLGRRCVVFARKNFLSVPLYM